MRILISDTIDQLENENKLIQGNLNNITSLMDGMQQMVDTVWLEGRTYASMKEYYNYTVIPLTKALYFMLDDKTKANIQYEKLLQSYFGGKIEYNREELMSQQKKIRMCREKIQRVSEVLRLCKGMCVVLYAMEIKLQEQIDLGEQFLAASSGIYDDVKELKAVFSKGLESMKEAICNDMGQCINIKAINKDWWTELDDIIQKKNWIHSIEEYRKYLEEHPEDREKIYKIIEFESMHPTDVKKINQFLSPLKEKTAIEIKYQAYMAREPYRSLWIKYLDRYKILSTTYKSDSLAKFVGKNDAIYINEESLEFDSRGKYCRFFHECGHAIDYYSGNRSWYSSSYRDLNGKTLEQYNKYDVENNIRNKIDSLLTAKEYSNLTIENKKELRDEVLNNIMAGNKYANVNLSPSASELQKEIEWLYKEELSGPENNVASDIYGGCTNLVIQGNFSHSQEGYWNRVETSTECYAEYYSLQMIDNQDAIRGGEKYLYNSYELINKMMREMK